MAAAPLSQTTQSVQTTLQGAEESVQDASRLKDQMYQAQMDLISSWQGAASTKYMANAENMHDDLTNVVQRLQTIMEQGNANVNNVASADNG
jgi:uncharacterized protein YukE